MSRTGWNIVPTESNGGVPVNIQDQHTRALDLFFTMDLTVPTTLLANANIGDTSLQITDTTGFTAGTYVSLFQATGEFFYATQIGAPVGNVITLDTPIDKQYTIALSSITPTTKNMAVNGTLIAPKIFKIGPVGTNVTIDIIRLLGYIQDDVVMDDAKFGGLPALTNGVVLRNNNHIINNQWNVKTNGEIALLTFDTAYTPKAPAGSYGYRFRNTYNGLDKHGVVFRLSPTDTLEILIQDNLTLLEKFNMMAQGHYTTN